MHGSLELKTVRWEGLSTEQSMTIDGRPNVVPQVWLRETRSNTAGPGPHPGRRGASPSSWTGRWPSPAPGAEHPWRLLVKVKGHYNICLVSTKRTLCAKVNRAEAKSLGWKPFPSHFLATMTAPGGRAAKWRAVLLFLSVSMVSCTGMIFRHMLAKIIC